MSYIALYRKWRPKKFEDVVHQDFVVETLKNAVLNKRIAHAYLFCGSKGTGKTTMAKIFARAINCLNPQTGSPCNECEICKSILNGSLMDVIEIDAASNNSVDNVREIRDEVIYTPAKATFKVYIIDEVHMLSTGAFNALLKTLEEPPSHAVFILATTEPHKLLPTVLSRCQRFDFKRIPVESIIQRLTEIANVNDITLSPQALNHIAQLADGALRDAISLLDQCISTGKKTISEEDLILTLGIVGHELLSQTTDFIIENNINSLLTSIEEVYMQGKDLKTYLSELIKYLRDLLILNIAGNFSNLTIIDESSKLKMTEQSKNLGNTKLIAIIKELSLLENSLKWSLQPRISLEVGLIKIANGIYTDKIDSLEEKVENLEKFIKNMDFTKKEVTKDIPRACEEVKKKLKPKVIVNNLEKLPFWNEIRQSAKKMGKLFLYTSLINTYAVMLDTNKVGVVFDQDNHVAKIQVSKHENLQLLKTLIEDQLQNEIIVKCVDEEDLPYELQKKSTTNTISTKSLEDIANEIGASINTPVNIID